MSIGFIERNVTEKKYNKLRKWTLLCCALSIIIYILLIRHAEKVNPDDFVCFLGSTAPIEKCFYSNINGEEIKLCTNISSSKPYNPKTNKSYTGDCDKGLIKLKGKLWWVIGIGWVIIIILFIREIRSNPNHWIIKLFKKLDEKTNEEDENNALPLKKEEKIDENNNKI